MTVTKRGGIRFIRIGRLTITICRAISQAERDEAAMAKRVKSLKSR